jgi:hypothetical protein
MQRKVWGSGHSLAVHHCCKLRFGRYTLQNTTLKLLQTQPNKTENLDELSLDSQTLAAFGAACIDNGTATRRFHACQKAMRTSAANFRGLVSAFHDSS